MEQIVIKAFFCLLLASVGESRSCFNCSSVNDNYCPELMTSDDESIVPYVSCNDIHGGRFCIKTTGVNGGTSCIRCFHCSDVIASGCSDDHFNAPLLECNDVFEAYFCIKSLEEYYHNSTRSLGTTRFCSSRDMGNYCEYIRRPGDKLEYRSCVFTCSSDGCNGSSIIKSTSVLFLITIISLIINFTKN